jgi:hypothetical protein
MAANNKLILIITGEYEAFQYTTTVYQNTGGVFTKDTNIHLKA